MWTTDADNRAFLCELTYEVIAAVAPEELEDYAALVAVYFANPAPPRCRRPPGGPARAARLTPAAPAIMVAVLNLLVFDILYAAQYDRSGVVMLALKRILRQCGAHPHERAALCAGAEGPVFSLVVLLYTRPVMVEVTLSQITHVAYEAARIYGLSADQADRLVPLAVSRLILGPGTLKDQGEA